MSDYNCNYHHFMNNKQRIAIYSISLAGGGSERFAALLASGLCNRGYTVHLLTREPEDNEYDVDPKVRRCTLHGSNANFISHAFALRRYLSDNAIETCIAVGIYPNLISCLANVLGTKTRIIISERNAPKEDRLSSKSKMLRALLYRHADAFHFQVPEARNFYCSSIRRRSFVIPNPLKGNLPERGEGDKRKKEIVAVGRLMPQKNYPMLLRAFAIVCQSDNDYSLHIYGQGILLDELKAYAATLGIDGRVCFEGYAINVHQRITNSDIYVLSSDFEGLSNSLMEAMAMGFPVVATDCPCGGARMLISNEDNGLLTPVGNHEAMAAAILRMINNSEEKERMATAAKRAAEKYSLDNIINLWEQSTTTR